MSFDAVFKVIDFVAEYTVTWQRVASSPTLFFREIDRSDAKTLPEAIQFYAVSIIIASLLHMPFARGESDLVTGTLGLVIYHLLSAILYSGIGFLAWRIVGAQLSAPKWLGVLLYVYGVAVLIMSVSGLLAKSVIKTNQNLDFDLYLDYLKTLALNPLELDQETFRELAGTTELFLSMSILSVGNVVLLLWLLMSWLSYGEVKRIGRARSVGALIMYLLVIYPVTYILSIIYYAAEWE
jgi:hypothetical protein